MKEALEKKDLDLAAAQKEAREKTSLADKKLASVGKLEEENSKLKTADSHGETSLSSSSVQGKLVGNVVVAFCTALVFIFGGLIAGNIIGAVLPAIFAWLIH